MAKLLSKVADDDNNEFIKVRIAKSAYRKLVLRRLRTVVLLSLVGLLVVYICFAATLFRVSVTNHGLVANKNVTYEGGILPVGAEAFVGPEAQEKGIITNLKNAFTYKTDTAVVEIVAGPHGKIEWLAPNVIIVDGVNKNVSFPAAQREGEEVNPLEDKEFLQNEYLVKCMSGNCVEGNAFIVGNDNIIGVPL